MRIYLTTSRCCAFLFTFDDAVEPSLRSSSREVRNVVARYLYAWFEASRSIRFLMSSNPEITDVTRVTLRLWYKIHSVEFLYSIKISISLMLRKFGCYAILNGIRFVRNFGTFCSFKVISLRSYGYQIYQSYQIHSWFIINIWYLCKIVFIFDSSPSYSKSNLISR